MAKTKTTKTIGMREFPEVVLRAREGNDFVDLNTWDLLRNKKVVIFGLPGAFTPTCTISHLPGYEKDYLEYKLNGIDEIYCHSVNDSFVMAKWFESLGIQYVKPLADGSGHLAAMLNTLVTKVNCGFGLRTWRYAAIVDNLQITIWAEEPGKRDEYKDDPYDVSSSENILPIVQKQFIDSIT